MNEAKYIWMNGEFKPWKEAQTHVLSHTLHYGNGVIEGTKAYKTAKGYAIFRLNDHTARLLESAKMHSLNFYEKMNLRETMSIFVPLLFWVTVLWVSIIKMHLLRLF